MSLSALCVIDELDINVLSQEVKSLPRDVILAIRGNCHRASFTVPTLSLQCILSCYSLPEANWIADNSLTNKLVMTWQSPELCHDYGLEKGGKFEYMLRCRRPSIALGVFEGRVLSTQWNRISIVICSAKGWR